jgi:hypothetical protein
LEDFDLGLKNIIICTFVVAVIIVYIRAADSMTRQLLKELSAGAGEAPLYVFT